MKSMPMSPPPDDTADSAEPADDSGDAQDAPAPGFEHPPESVNAASEDAYERVQMQCEATQLMTAARTGSVEAFETLFEMVRGNAFHAARSLVGSNEDARDLTQEAFLKAYKARASYDPKQPFLPWFHRILRNTCFSFLRKRGRLREQSMNRMNDHGEEREWDVVDENVADPSDGLVLAEREDTFSKALDKLSAKDREILVLRHYQELSYKDIAAALSIPEGTVMSRLFHARKRLKGLLASQVVELVGTESSGPATAGSR